MNSRAPTRRPGRAAPFCARANPLSAGSPSARVAPIHGGAGNICRALGLRPAESSVLKILIDADGDPVDRDTILQEIGSGSANSKVISVYICRIRARLRECGIPLFVKRSRKGFYQISGEPEQPKTPKTRKCPSRRTADAGRNIGGVFEIVRKWGRVILDPEDAHLLDDWVVGGIGRPKITRVVLFRRRGRGPRGSKSLARHLLGADSSVVVDHINGNPLDNRRSNLRICTHVENSRNRTAISGRSSAFKGVKKHRTKWVACIGHLRTSHHLGVFESEVDAAEAYDRAARKLHGKFASLNFPEVGERSAHVVGDHVHAAIAAPHNHPASSP